MSALFGAFFSCCCRQGPIHNNNQPTVWVNVFLHLRLRDVAGWLWRFPQAERLEKALSRNLNKKQPPPVKKP